MMFADGLRNQAISLKTLAPVSEMAITGIQAAPLLAWSLAIHAACS